MPDRSPHSGTLRANPGDAHVDGYYLEMLLLPTQVLKRSTASVRLEALEEEVDAGGYASLSLFHNGPRRPDLFTRHPNTAYNA